MIAATPDFSHPHAGWRFAINKITRHIATLKASDGGYIRLPQPIEILPDDDFELEIVVQVERDDANYDSVLASVEEAPRVFFIRKNRYKDGGETWEHGGYQLWMERTNGFAFVYPKIEHRHPEYVTKFNRISIKRRGKILSLYLNGEYQGESDIGAESWLPFTITRINEQATCRSLEFKFTKNGQVIFEPDLNAQHGTTIIPNLAQPLGSELVINGTFDSNIDGWVSGNADLAWDSAGKCRVNTIGNNYTHARSSTFDCVANKTYLVTCEVSDINTGQLRFGINFSGTQVWAVESLSGNGKYEGVVQAPITGNGLFEIQAINSPTTAWSIDNVSIKEAPHWAEYINVTDDNKELYTFDSERNGWIGEELWNTSTGYAVNTGASTSTYDGQVGHLQTLGDYTGLRQIDVQTVGATYLFSCEVFDVIDSGSGYLTLGENYGDGRNIPITPKLDAIFKADTTYAQVKRAHGSYDLKLRNISFKRMLEVAQ